MCGINTGLFSTTGWTWSGTDETETSSSHHWSRNQVSNIPEIIPGATPGGPKRSTGVPGCANGSLFREVSVPHFRPPAVVQVLTVNEGPSRASRRALVWSALRGSELRQKVSWFPRNDARRCTDFCPLRYEQCTASSKTTRRFRWQAVALQMKGAKIHAPPGTLPWEPRYLLRPFTPTGEADGDAQ